MKRVWKKVAVSPEVAKIWVCRFCGFECYQSCGWWREARRSRQDIDLIYRFWAGRPAPKGVSD